MVKQVRVSIMRILFRKIRKKYIISISENSFKNQELQASKYFSNCLIIIIYPRTIVR